jgi:prevent-host-death family protein
MALVNVHQAKTHLSQLLQQVEQGEEVVIARAGVPIRNAHLLAVAELESGGEHRDPLDRLLVRVDGQLRRHGATVIVF